MNSNSRKSMSIIAYFLSEYDLEAVKALGYKNRKLCFEGVSSFFKLNDDYLRLRRDEFAALPSSRSTRTGFSKRPPNTLTVQIAKDLHNFTFEDLLNMIYFIINNPEETYANVLNFGAQYIIQSIYPETADLNDCYEGAKTTVTVNRYERNLEARQKCINHHGCYCHICNLDFKKVYGELGNGFIHVHHIKPLHEIKEGYIVDPINDLIPVCPNCHAMLHRKLNGKNITIDELKDMITF
ncbi:HNH endonuclease [Chakrabartyella piscis]|uniref:HNH endonuclease n=1 Tax=Chakrabartyella piscis TaxID=2918914 RepID=UPI002958792F|nr:HNH endonuclease [Chakrabartyella piscis]